MSAAVRHLDDRPGRHGVSLEGSTIREGKYRDNIRRAVDWLMDRVQPNGLIGNPDQPDRGRPIHVRPRLRHAVPLLRRRRGRERQPAGASWWTSCEKAAKYTRDAQTNRGGWGYVSAKDGSNFDEGSVTITQVQALRAARNAGIIVPNEAIKDAIKYLRDSTTAQGGIIYSLAFGGGGRSEGRPALTAAAIACGFSAGEYQGDLVKKWLEYCQNT